MENKILPEGIQKKVDEVAQKYESATQHAGLGPAIFKEGVEYAFACAKVMADNELSTLKAQQGGWVKASERLPGLKTAVKWRADGIEMKAKALWYMVHDTNSEYLSNCEWYDESPSEPEQKEAVEFAQVLEAMEWVKMSNWGFARGIGWQVYGDPNPSKYLTTAQLYEQYLQQKG